MDNWLYPPLKKDQQQETLTWVAAVLGESRRPDAVRCLETVEKAAKSYAGSDPPPRSAGFWVKPSDGG